MRQQPVDEACDIFVPTPERVVAVGPLLLAVALSIRLRRFLSGRRGREKIWPAVTLGVIGLLLASLAVQGAFYRTVQAYEQCVDGAQTAQAKADCESLRDSVVLGDILTLR